MDEGSWCRLAPGEQGAVREYLARIRGQFGGRVLAVSLFGSKARGDADAESDIDLLVLVDDEDKSLRSLLWAIASDVSLEHNLVLSVRVYAEARWVAGRRMGLPLCRAIETEGLLLLG